MARKPRTNGKANGVGEHTAAPATTHNKAPLSEEDQTALTTHYQLKIVEAQRRVDAIQVDLKSARDVVNGHFKRMTADLGVTRQDFEREVIANLNKSEAEYLAAERKRTRLHRLAGLKVGEQLDLLDRIQDTIDDEIDAEANGYRAGRRADDPVPPKTIAPIMHPAWMRGYHRGVEENGRALARAGEIIAAREAKKPELRAETQPQQHDVDPEAQIAEDAQNLINAGWADPAPEEAFEEASA